jgi:hypothetical protein
MAESPSLYDGVTMLCSVQANLEPVFKAAPTLVGKDGKKYREVVVRHQS